ncbi:MAG: ISKra4 family transposase, partial [Anaerolineae bacterium]
MPLARSAAQGFFPLDEELALLPGLLTPALQEALVRLSTRLPFRQAVEELARLKQVTTTEATVRRHTEAAGAAYVAWQIAEVERLERTVPVPEPGPVRQLVSPDGAMVPLVHREWAEVKTVAIGAIQPPLHKDGETVVRTTELSYFSRLAEAETFTHLATVETQRRGTEHAETVCAVSDGAEWIQGFFDVQCHAAVRILDFYHAASYVAKIGQAQLGAGTPAFQAWLTTTLHELKHGSPDQVLQTLRMVQQQLQGGSASPETLDEVRTAIQYLETRRPHIEYARFQAAGYPIGSGSVESGNKLVVEVRLKGAGMHWARAHVDPMLALRDMLCSERWDADWPQIARQLRQQQRTVREQRRQARLAPRHSSRPDDLPPVPSAAKAAPRVAARKLPHPEGKAHRPADNHPWRHMPVGRAVFL